MEITNKRSKIFIQNIKSKLGYHIVETLRNDHQELENYSLIVGSTLEDQCQQHHHSSIHATVDFRKNTNLFAKCIIQSNIIVIDIREPTQQTEFIIKVLQEKFKHQHHTNKTSSCKQNTYIIGIGSHMTWAYQKPCMSKLQSQKQQLLPKCLQWDPQKQEPIHDHQKSKRVPHHLWIRQQQLQKSIIGLNKYSNVRASVLTIGLLYGKDIPSPEIEDFVARCFGVRDQVWVYGDGNNILPTLHVDDFCRHLQCLLKYLQRTEKIHQHYFISVDQKLGTQLEIVEYFLKRSGYIKQIGKQPLTYITKQQALYSQSVPLKKSSLFGTQTSCSFILNYFHQLAEQASQYLQLQPTHYLIYGQEMQSSVVEELTTHLATVVQVFRQADFCEQLARSKNIVKEDVDVHEVNSMIEEVVFKGHAGQNYVVVLNQNLFDISIVRKYNLRKFQIQEDAKFLLSHKYPQYGEVGNKQEKPENCLQMQPCPQIRAKSSQALKSEIKINTTNKQVQQYQRRQQLRLQMKLKQYRKYDQYLLDNVCGFVAEAIMNSAGSLELSNFVDNLKKIYQRELKSQTQQIM